MINLKLLESRKINKNIAFKILEKQHKRENILLSMYFCDNNNVLRLYYQELVQNEFDLQELWGFKRDAKTHLLHGYHIPKCLCPTEDNEERRGLSEERIINNLCPIHGDSYE